MIGTLSILVHWDTEKMKYLFCLSPKEMANSTISVFFQYSIRLVILLHPLQVLVGHCLQAGKVHNIVLQVAHLHFPSDRILRHLPHIVKLRYAFVVREKPECSDGLVADTALD